MTDSEPNPNKSTAKRKPTAASVSVSELMTTPSRAVRPHGIEAAKKLARSAIKVALENNAVDAMLLDVSDQSAEFDFFVLASGSSRRQLHAISEQIDDVLQKELGDVRLGIEGYQESSWIVLDYGNVVIHLFDEETREFYDLEQLWADGKRILPADLGLSEDGAEIISTETESN